MKNQKKKKFNLLKSKIYNENPIFIWELWLWLYRYGMALLIRNSIADQVDWIICFMLVRLRSLCFNLQVVKYSHLYDAFMR